MIAFYDDLIGGDLDTHNISYFTKIKDNKVLALVKFPDLHFLDEENRKAFFNDISLSQYQKSNAFRSPQNYLTLLTIVSP